MNLNKIIIVGRATSTPTLKTSKGGQSVTSFSVATNRFWTDKSNKKNEETEFHNVVLWGKLADIASQYVVKGSELLIEGRLHTRSWEDKEKNKRYITEIIGESMQLGQKPAGAAAKPKEGKADEITAPVEEVPVIDMEDDLKPEDLPF